MHFLKYLFLLFALFLTQITSASCPYPATYEGISHKPFPNTVCYPESGTGTGYCQFKIIDNGLDIKVPCTSGNCSSQGYAIQLQSLSSKVYKNSDCTNPPIQDGCFQAPDGSIECEEQNEDDESPILECSTESCLNPQNKRCPVGYTRGSLNGQSICVKSKTQNPEDPTECTGEDCGIRTDRIVTAVNNSNNDITTSIDNLSTVFDAPFETLKQYLSDISDKLSLMTDKIGNSGNSGSENPPEQEVDTSQLQADVPFNQTDKQQISSNIFSSKSQCPQSRVLSLPKYGISYEFSFDQICSFLSLLSYFVMIIAYVIAAYIVVKA